MKKSMKVMFVSLINGTDDIQAIQRNGNFLLTSRDSEYQPHNTCGVGIVFISEVIHRGIKQGEGIICGNIHPF